MESAAVEKNARITGRFFDSRYKITNDGFVADCEANKIYSIYILPPN